MLLTIVYTLKTVIFFGFFISWKTGQLIANSTLLVLSYIVAAITNLLLLLNVISEDFVLFLRDLAGALYGSIELLNSAYRSFDKLLQNSLKYIGTTYNLFASCLKPVVQTVYSIITSIGTVFILVKRIIVLFGQGTWFVLTFLPNLIYDLSMLLVDLIRYTSEYTSQKLLEAQCVIIELYNFLTDVPLESFIGLLTAVCLGYILVQFHIVLYDYFQRGLWRFSVKLKRKYNYLKRRVLIRFQKNTQARNQQNAANIRPQPKAIADDRYCIICQERSRCILILPCRHLCTCSECTARLMLYTGTCPVCRNNIDQSIKVFM